MIALPWYLRLSSKVFCAIAAFKFLEVYFVFVGVRTATRGAADPAEATFILGFRVVDALLYAVGWLASAVLASLLLRVYDRVTAAHA